MHCKENFNDGSVKCKENFTCNYGSKSQAFSSFSILMDMNSCYCNMCCSYCCCSKGDGLEPGKGEEINYSTFKLNKEKLISKIKSSPLYKEGGSIHFDVWCGEIFYNLKAFKETLKVLRDEWSNCSITVSTNGILMSSESLVDFIIDNRISIQLSHDGLGQWIRSGEFDPLKDEKCLKGLKRINDAGLFAAINCTLSYYNYSWFKNIRYFNKVIDDNNLNRIGQIKLNHIYESEYNIKKLNSKGHWQDGFKGELVNTPIGDLTLRGRVLDDYLQEFFQLACLYRDPSFKIDYKMSLYKGYVMEQSKRFRELKHDENGEIESSGACRAYQSYVHNVEGNVKRDYTFVITTSGEYGECNLSKTVEAPGNPQPDYCKDCKYRWQSECHPCGSMKMSNDCEYLYKWCQTLEKIHCMDALLNNSIGNSKNGNNQRG